MECKQLDARQTHPQTEADRQTERHTQRQRQRQADRQRQRDRGRQTEAERQRQTDRGRQTEAERQRQTDRGRETAADRQRQRDSGRETELSHVCLILISLDFQSSWYWCRISSTFVFSFRDVSYFCQSFSPLILEVGFNMTYFMAPWMFSVHDASHVTCRFMTCVYIYVHRNEQCV